MTDLSQPAANDQKSAAADIKDSCGNCKFSDPVPRDFSKVECRFNPPTASMVPMPQRGGGLALQQVCSFPCLPRNFHCHQHRRKLVS